MAFTGEGMDNRKIGRLGRLEGAVLYGKQAAC